MRLLPKAAVAFPQLILALQRGERGHKAETYTNRQKF